MSSSFETTRWTLVVTARADDSTVSREALARLCQAYWPPLYAFVRRHGYDADEARDLTQAYFTELLRLGKTCCESGLEVRYSPFM